MDTSSLTCFSAQELGERIHIYGRTAFAGSALALFWTGSGIALNSLAREIWVELEADWEQYEPWVSVWVNGEQVSRFMVQKGKAWYCLFRGIQGFGVNRFAILKETQAMSADEKHSLLVHSVGFAAKGLSLGELVLPPPKYALNIEFIGDSITTGEGLCGATQEMDWIPAWMALRENYALNIARHLNADFRILSQSGWGVVCSWDGDYNCALPRYYNEICGLAKGKCNEALGASARNNFFAWQPNVIVVNLGTNDAGAFTKNTSAKNEESLRAGITRFLKTLRCNNPKAHIIWAYGMVSFDWGMVIEDAVCGFAKDTNDAKITFIRLPSMQDEFIEEKGSRLHPGSGTHKRACKALLTHIKALL